MSKPAAEFEPLALAVLTVSDTRTPDNDTSGDLLVQRLQEAGHQLQARQIVKDDIYQLRKVVSEWIADERIPWRQGQRVASAAETGSSIWLVPGVDHVDAFLTHPDEYVKRVSEYFDSRFK